MHNGCSTYESLWEVSFSIRSIQQGGAVLKENLTAPIEYWQWLTEERQGMYTCNSLVHTPTQTTPTLCSEAFIGRWKLTFLSTPCSATISVLEKTCYWWVRHVTNHQRGNKKSCSDRSSLKRAQQRSDKITSVIQQGFIVCFYLECRH